MKQIYFDNNGTTQIENDVVNELCSWAKSARNPSSSSKTANECREMIQKSKDKLLQHCGAYNTRGNEYTVIYTSGATESNCCIIKSCALSFRRIRGFKPVIIISAIEHESIISACNNLSEDDIADIIQVMPNCEGSIAVHSIEKAINEANKDNQLTGNRVALISVMFANNEIGTINNIREIGALAHKHNIPFHTDAVQGFGKFRIDLVQNNIDALSASYHKFYGPMGLGILIIKNNLISGYNLIGIINGRQQEGLRGGTENVPAIAAGSLALELAFRSRPIKNQHLFKLRNYFIKELSKRFPIGLYENYVRRSMQERVDLYPIMYDPASRGGEHIEGGAVQSVLSIDALPQIEICILGPPIQESARILPNTILLSVVKNVADKYGPFCNVKLRSDLDNMNCIVSIGSNCNTGVKEISHVLRAIKMPPNVGRGVIRVSFGDSNTTAEIDTFLDNFETCVWKQAVRPQKINNKLKNTTRTKKNNTTK